MIKINSLYSLEHVSDCYVLDDENNIINNNTGSIKAVSISKRGYPYVSLNSATQNNRQVKVPIHKIIALARIANKPYKLIEHLDDNKLNNDPNNLLFSNHQQNGLRSFVNGCHNVNYREYDVVLFNGNCYRGPLKEISKLSGISVGTLYDYYYRNKSGITLDGQPVSSRTKIIGVSVADD